MRKKLTTIAAVLCCTLTATLFHSCGDEETTYVTSYTYEIGSGRMVDFVGTEYQSILNALNSAIGTDGHTYRTHSSIKDEEMKAACDAVAAQFSNIESIYLTFPLIRATVSAEPNTARVYDTIAIYSFGRAMEMPYVKYYYNSNEDSAKAQLNAIKDSIGEDLYKASRRTLIRIRTQFNNSLENWLSVHTPEAEQFEQRVTHICDSVATAHANDTLAVDARVWIDKKSLLNGQSNRIWSHTFPKNN